MCPLIAKDGSPWTGEKAVPCPQDEKGCAWWPICSKDEMRETVEAATAGHPMPVFGPNRPRSYEADPKKVGRTFDCRHAAQCSWQIAADKAGQELCPPREALKRGFDPRITLF
jgi:hypothetical protein